MFNLKKMGKKLLLLNRRGLLISSKGYQKKKILNLNFVKMEGVYNLI